MNAGKAGSPLPPDEKVLVMNIDCFDKGKKHVISLKRLSSNKACAP
jgi:hypothetical protein